MSNYKCFGPVKPIELKETAFFPKRICYDIYEEKEAERKSTEDDTAFYQDALINKNLLFRWAQFAGQIFQSDSDSYWNHSGKSWKDNFGEKANYMDLIDYLCNKRSKSGGDDVHMSTGLVLTDSLEKVETAAGKMAQDLLSRKLKGPEFIARANLAPLHNKQLSSNKVYYTLAGIMDRYGKTFQFGYTIFGIAFYDFRLKVVSDGTRYNTAIGNKTVEEAKKEVIPGFSYQEIDGGKKVINTAENRGTGEISQTVEKTVGISQSESNAITNSEEYSFTESIGLEVALSTVIPVADVTMQMGFEAGQVIGTTYSKEKSITKSEENTSSVTVTVPAHTAVVVNQHESKTVTKLDYDCPVMIQYNVAIFSICGTCYDDNLAVQSFSTAGYDQRSFITLFGPSEAGTEVEDAADNQYMRYLKRTQPGYEETFGITEVKSHYKGMLHKTLNWDKIIGQDPASTGYKGCEKKPAETDTPENLIKKLCTERPMAPTGATLTDSGSGITTEVCDAIPLYPLTNVNLLIGSTKYDTGKDAELNANNWITQGVDGAAVNFYGYIHDKGEWILVDEYGNILEDRSIAYSEKDRMTGDQIIHTVGKGIVYAKYLIPENFYTCQSGAKISNDTIQTVFIKIEIHDTSLDGRIEVEGCIEVKLGSITNLEEMRSHVHVYDETGTEIVVPVIWEADSDCHGGIVVVNNRMQAKKTGTYHIRACYETLTSDWVEVNVKM